MRETSTLMPNLSENSSKSAKYRIVLKNKKYYPQEKFLWIWWNMAPKGYMFLTAEFDTFDDAQSFIKLLTDSEAKETCEKATVVQAYYSKSGALYV